MVESYCKLLNVISMMRVIRCTKFYFPRIGARELVLDPKVGQITSNDHHYKLISKCDFFFFISIPKCKHMDVCV